MLGFGSWNHFFGQQELLLVACFIWKIRFINFCKKELCMQPEKSCGAVVFRNEGNKRLYLILHYEEGHWDLPKGHVEEGESEKQTALREIREETGISGVDFIDGFRKEISYSFLRQGKRISKKVVFFLAETQEKDVALSCEHVGYEWLEYKDALKRITYGNARRVLEEAERFLPS
jgi:8-oxo-dGTP pyrophosphatase MutT (NUDIX family)